MTYRTMDTDHVDTTPDVSAPVRHIRRRRRALAMGYHSSGAVVSGFGI